MKPVGALWRLVVSGIVAGILLLLIVNAIQQSVTADQRSYTAEFTDASGLHLDADVRVRGVSVGRFNPSGLSVDTAKALLRLALRSTNDTASCPRVGWPSNTRPLPACGT